MKANNKLSRAERRRIQKRTNSQPAVQKSIIAILLEFLNYQRIGIVIAVIALILAYPEFKNNIDGWRRGVDVLLGDYTISNDERVMVYYLLPDIIADLDELEVTLPLAISNKKSKNISNLEFDLRQPLSEEQINTMIKQGDTYHIWHPRFSNDGEIMRVSRSCVFSTNTREEVVSYAVDELNSHMSIPVHEVVKLYPKTQPYYKNGYVNSVKDAVLFEFNLGFKDIAETFKADVCVCGLNYDAIDELIYDIDQRGQFPLSSDHKDDKKREVLRNKTVYVISPQVLNNEEYSYDILDVDIYKLEYTSKKFRKRRQLTIENKGNTEVLKFKDFSELEKDPLKQMYNGYKIKYI